jgi:hypothetical protein
LAGGLTTARARAWTDGGLQVRHRARRRLTALALSGRMLSVDGQGDFAMTSANAEKPDAEPANDAEPESRAEVEKRELMEAIRAAPDKFPSPNDAPPVRIKVDDDLQTWTVDHPDKPAALARLLETLATTDFDFANGLLSQLIQMGTRRGSFNEHEANFMLSTIRVLAPRDPLETMLIAQMSSVHNAIMKLGDSLDNLSRETQERMFNRLARTFVAQAEALRRLRGGGAQSFTVQNVSVSDGSQAIVSSVKQAGRESAVNLTATASPPVAPRDATPMPIIDDCEDAQQPVAVPVKANNKQ